MKCDKLKAYGMADPAIDDEYEMYKVADVMEAVAELKEAWRSEHEACEALKAKLEDAGMCERRLRRALYKACANWAMNARMVEIETKPWGENHESRLWADVYDKCLKKAEEYK